MRATDDQIAYLDALLGLLSGEHEADEDPGDQDRVLVYHKLRFRGSAGKEHVNRVPSHLSLSLADGGALAGRVHRAGIPVRAPAGEPLWIVECAVTSGGTRDDPPDVDVYEAHPPARWEMACRNLLVSLLSDLADRVDDMRLDRLEAEAAAEHVPGIYQRPGAAPGDYAEGGEEQGRDDS